MFRRLSWPVLVLASFALVWALALAPPGSTRPRHGHLAPDGSWHTRPPPTACGKYACDSRACRCPSRPINGNETDGPSWSHGAPGPSPADPADPPCRDCAKCCAPLQSPPAPEPGGTPCH